MAPRYGFSFDDPMVEASILWGRTLPRVVLPAGGGDVAIALQALFPGGTFVLYDRDEAQLDLVRAKVAALPDAALGVCERGATEALLRVFRAWLNELVAPEPVVEAALAGDAEAAAKIVGHPAWPLAFEAVFSDAVLGATVRPSRGPARGWAGWLQAVVEAALASPNAARDPYLHHVLLGAFPKGAEPPWSALSDPAELRFTYLRGGAADVADLELADLVVISGLWDAPDDDALAATARVLGANMRPNAVLLARMVDPRARPEDAFEGFLFDAEWARTLHESDRGLVWARMAVGVKR